MALNNPLNNLKIALFLGFKSIAWGNKATLVLMIFILSLAFVNQIFISSVLNGVVDTVNKQVANNIVSNIVIDPQEKPTQKDFILHAEDLERQIENLPGVTATARRYKLAATLAYDKEKNGKYKFVSTEVSGIDPEREAKVTGVASKIVAGRYLEGLGSGEMVLGADIAGGYSGTNEFTSLGGVKVGDTVKATFSNGIIRDYKVKGIFRTKFDMADRAAFITSKEAESMLSISDNASEILVRTATFGEEDKYMKRIRDLAPNLKVRKWKEYMGPAGGISDSFGIIVFIISIIGIAVAAVTIFIMIYINVVNKKRQIGILKAIGIQQNIIIYSYIFQALFYAFFGVILGLLMVFYAISPYFTIHPLELPMGDSRLVLDNSQIAYATLSMLIAALVAGFIPSWQTARENILKAIWGN